MIQAEEIDALRSRSDAFASHPLAPWLLRGAYVVLAVVLAAAIWRSTLAPTPEVAAPLDRGTATASTR